MKKVGIQKKEKIYTPLDSPAGIIYNPEDHSLFICDDNHFALQKVLLQGTHSPSIFYFLSVILEDNKVICIAKPSRPSRIDTTESGILFVTSFDYNRIYKYIKQGMYLPHFKTTAKQRLNSKYRRWNLFRRNISNTRFTNFSTTWTCSG